MSQRASGSKIRVPQSQSGLRQPSATRPQSATNAPGDANKAAEDKAQAKKPEKKTIEFQLPPLSIVGKKREINFDEIRKKVIRRNAPEDEDKKELASILKHLRQSKSKIRVHEFVGLVSKFTVDNGEIMRKVLEDDLAAFRKMVTKVYENMTQDVSDVLVNEQIQTSNYYDERYDMLNDKVLGMIHEIYQMIPEFDFEKFAKDPDEYLGWVDPLPQLVVREAGAVDIQRRQEAFHRLQWLKIESGRLAQENKRLEEKLNSLREEHERSQEKANLKAQIMQERKHNLEEEEHKKQEHLHQLEGLLGKSAVRAEAYVRLEEDEGIRLTKPLPPKDKNKKAKKGLQRPAWSSVTAADVEIAASKSVMDAENAVAEEKKRQKRKANESQFGFNPTASSSRQFSQTGERDYPGLPSATRKQERTVQKTTTTVQERRKIPGPRQWQ